MRPAVWRRWAAAAGAVAGLVAGVSIPVGRAAAGEPELGGSVGGQAGYERAMKNGAAAAARRDFGACVAEHGSARDQAPDAERKALAEGEAGLCEEARGRAVEAFDLLRRALEREPGPMGGGGRGAWKRFADAVDRLQRRVVRALVLVMPDDAEVLLDGATLGRRLSGRYITVAPGLHTWTARLAGFLDTTFSLEARGGDYPDVRLLLEPRPGDGPALPCNAACREAIRADGEAEGVAKARAQASVSLRLLVREAVERIYRQHVDPSLSLIAGGALSAGLTLDVGPGFYLGGEARWRAFDQLGPSIGLEVQTLFPTKAIVFDDGTTMDVTQIVVAAVPCLQYKWLSGCVFGDVGLLLGGGQTPLYFDGGGVLVTAGFGPRLGFQIPFADRFMLRGFAELRVSPINTGWMGNETAPGARWGNPLVTGLFGLGVSFGEPVRRESREP
jgi:hypothetical protein